MTIQITGKNLDVGDALREYTEHRIHEMLEKYVGKSFPGHIRIEKNKNEFNTHCSVDLWSGLSLHSQGNSDNAHTSVDIALERLDKRLRRYKSRLRDHHNNQHNSAAELAATDYLVEHEGVDEINSKNLNPVIIAEKQTIIRELTVSDAVMELDLANRPFLLFKNAAHGRINVVYRREDGNIGWIDPGTLSQ
ncbi:MAG: ribosome-associated translation inhibitor RaiA [bacterium]|nr:ribosome-associated translation inhibitor RaiA [bacterium]